MPFSASTPFSPALTRGGAVALGGLLAGAMALPALPAQAHDVLVSADPAEGAVLSEVPADVVLTYSAEILPQGAAITVVGADGTDMVAEEPRIEGTDLIAPLDDGLGDGEYTVTWRVVSSDGHPIDGVYTFTLADSPAGEEPAATEDGAGATSAPALPSPTGAATAEAVQDTSTPAEADSAGSPIGTTVAVGAVVLALGVAAGLAVWRKLSTRKD